MGTFEAVLVLLLGATILSSFARRMAIPYPALLAVGRAVLAFIPGAALAEIEADDAPSAARLGQEYRLALERSRAGADPRDRADNVLRRRMVIAGRHAIEALRASSVIGDDAYRRVEEDLDMMELSSQPRESAS